MSGAVIKVVTGLGYGVVTFLFLKNSEGLGEYASEIARTTVHFWSRSPKDRLQADGSAGKGIGDLSDKLDKLAMMKRETVHVHHGEKGWSGWVSTAVGGTVAIVVFMHVSGLFDFSGIMYVTQSKFKSATDALKDAIDVVSKQLNKVRSDLLDRLGLLEKSLEEVSEELKLQIVSASEHVREDVAKVSVEVREVGSLVTGLESKLGSIDGGLGDLRTALEHANKGIRLLCHVVAESYKYSAAGNQREQKWYSDLLTYTSMEITGESMTLKQLKQSGDGPVLRLMSGPSLGGNADNGGGGAASFRETLTRQLSGVLPSTVN